MNNIDNYDIGLFSDAAVQDYETKNMMDKIEAVFAKQDERKDVTEERRVEFKKRKQPSPPEFPVWGKRRSSKTVEGYASNDGIAHFKPEDWDGVDTVDDIGEGDIADFREPIIDFINYIYNCILFVEQMVAYEITKTLSRGDFDEDDVDIVKKYVTWFFAICVSSYVVYNWFYVMFFRNDMDEKADVFEFSRKKIAEFAKTNMLLKIVEPYITFSFFFPEYLQKIFVNWMPRIVALKPTFQFVALFYLTVFVLYNFSNSFRQLFIDIVMVSMNDWVVLSMYFITGVLFFINFAYDFMWSIQAKIPFFQVFYFIKKLIYLIIVVMITPFLGGILSLGFILFISFFVLSSSSVTIQNIKDYTNIHYKNSDDKFCDPLTFWEKVKNFINLVFEYIYTYVFETSVIFMVLWSFYDYTHNISSDTLKNSLMILNCVIIVLVIFSSLFSFNAKLTASAAADKAGIAAMAAAAAANILTPNVSGVMSPPVAVPPPPVDMAEKVGK